MKWLMFPSLLWLAACLFPTEPEIVEEPTEAPCFLADTVGRGAEFNRNLPCWLFISECQLFQVCVSRGQPPRELTTTRCGAGTA